MKTNKIEEKLWKISDVLRYLDDKLQKWLLRRDNPQLYDRAIQLAHRSYQINVNVEEQGKKEQYFVASSPEFFLCHGVGNTKGEAVKDLFDCRTEIIYMLLERNEKIPEPGIIYV